jgi:hypothetical protein
MYAALWRALPGGRLVKSLECLALFLLVVAVLFLWVFPAVAPHLPFENVTLDPSATSAPPAGPAGSATAGGTTHP